jgi:hypothetical protein
MEQPDKITSEGNSHDVSPFAPHDDLTKQRYPRVLSYTKEALAKYRNINYTQALNGHYDVASANTLRYSVQGAVQMHSSTKRFKPDLKGAFFSNAYADNSGFGSGKPVFGHVTVKPTNMIDTEQPEITGRPLFERQKKQSKNSPAPNHYEVRRNTDIAPIKPDKGHSTFGHSFADYRRTMDISGGV